MRMLKSCLFALGLCAIQFELQAATASIEWHSLLTQAKPEAQTEWARKFEHGEGVNQDYRRAMYLYCAAAGKGYAPAQYRLGWLYANGRGVSRDDALAAAWFEVAAAQGHAQAKNMLGLLDGKVQAKKPLCSAAPRQGAVGSIPRVSPQQRRAVEKMVRRLAPQYKLDPSLVLAVIQVESAFQDQATSPKNAQGLMQLIPETADRFGVQDALNPLQNMRGGMAYLRWLLAYFQGDVELALAGYNAGENAVVKYQGVPPYPETQSYVEKIIQIYGNRTHPPVAVAVRPAANLTDFRSKASSHGASRTRRTFPIPIAVTERHPNKKSSY
jgi:hypothetical protein